MSGMVIGLWLAILQLPGLWLMLAMAAGYSWFTGGAHLGVIGLAVLLILALLAEAMETLMTAFGARKAGASKMAMILSIVGAILGGIFLSVVPIPILSTIIGVCLGAFLGAVVGEFAGGRDTKQSVLSGLGAAAGRLAGTLVKLGFGLVMLLTAAIIAFPWQPVAPAAGAAAGPTTAAATTTMSVER